MPHFLSRGPAARAFVLSLSVVACGTSCGADEKPPAEPSGGHQPATEPSTSPSGVKKLSVEEFDQLRKEKDAVVLDVRTPAEFAAGHVPGAVNVPLSGPGLDDFQKRVKDLDKEKTYLVHCAAGGRSAKATAQMKELGFPHLNDFSGGMNAWKNARKPVEAGKEEGKAKE